MKLLRSLVVLAVLCLGLFVSAPAHAASIWEYSARYTPGSFNMRCEFTLNINCSDPVYDYQINTITFSRYGDYSYNGVVTSIPAAQTVVNVGSLNLATGSGYIESNCCCSPHVYFYLTASYSKINRATGQVVQTGYMPLNPNPWNDPHTDKGSNEFNFILLPKIGTPIPHIDISTFIQVQGH